MQLLTVLQERQALQGAQKIMRASCLPDIGYLRSCYPTLDRRQVHDHMLAAERELEQARLHLEVALNELAELERLIMEAEDGWD